jgi:zinc-ribbon domain
MNQQCSTCGQLIQPDAPACPHCGAPQQALAPQPGDALQQQPAPQPGNTPEVAPSYAPEVVSGYPPQAQPGYPPQAQPGYPPQGQPAYPPQGQTGYPPQGQPGYPPQGQPGYPPQGAPGYPPQGQPAYPYPPQGAPGYPPGGAPMAIYGGGGLGALDKSVYQLPAPQSMIPPEQASAAMAHQLSPFPTAVTVILHFFTLGIFTTIYMGLQHGKLPVVAHDDPSAGKAIGFLFIPFYNIYWNFVFWLRLCDRLNFQYQMRGMEPSAPRGLALATIIVNLIPYVGFIVGYLIMMPILAGILQSKVNELASLEGR